MLSSVWPLSCNLSDKVEPTRDQCPHRNSLQGPRDMQASPPRQGNSTREGTHKDKTKPNDKKTSTHHIHSQTHNIHTLASTTFTHKHKTFTHKHLPHSLTNTKHSHTSIYRIHSQIQNIHTLASTTPHSNIRHQTVTTIMLQATTTCTPNRQQTQHETDRHTTGTSLQPSNQRTPQNINTH